MDKAFRRTDKYRFFLLGKEKVCNISYLQFKWGEMFSLLDVNHDHKLDKADIELSADYYIRVNNLTEQEV